MPAAQTLPPLNCAGTDPAWTLQFSQESAILDYLRESEMTIPQASTAEGRAWPRAFTLVSRNNTAIAVIDLEDCLGQPYAADVLTQHGQTPILLTGCCTPSP